MMGNAACMATNIMAAWPRLQQAIIATVIASSTLIFFYLMQQCYLSKSLYVWLSNKEDHERDRACVSTTS